MGNAEKSPLGQAIELVYEAKSTPNILAARRLLSILMSFNRLSLQSELAILAIKRSAPDDADGYMREADQIRAELEADILKYIQAAISAEESDG